MTRMVSLKPHRFDGVDYPVGAEFTAEDKYVPFLIKLGHARIQTESSGYETRVMTAAPTPGYETRVMTAAPTPRPHKTRVVKTKKTRRTPTGRSARG